LLASVTNNDVTLTGGNRPCQPEGDFERAEGSEVDCPQSRLLSSGRRTRAYDEDEATRRPAEVLRQRREVLHLKIAFLTFPSFFAKNN